MFGGEVLHCLCLGAVAGAGGISRLLHVMMSLRLASFKRVRNFGENSLVRPEVRMVLQDRDLVL